MSDQRAAPDVATESRSRRVLQSVTPESRGLSDSKLLGLISRGDLDALGVIHDSHIEAAWRIALHYSASTAAAEQVVSAVFLRLWRKPESDDQASFPARLLSSVAREARDSQQVLRGQRMSPNSGDQGGPLMAAVNEAIDRLHSSLDLADSDFFCECGSTFCKERITLSRGAYASLLDESRPLIAPAHADRESDADTELRTLRGQVHQLQGTLASRVNVEQAKGVLVERHGMSPDDAFAALRQRARDQRRSLDEVCAQIIAWAEIPDSEKSETAPSAASRPSRESHGR